MADDDKKEPVKTVPAETETTNKPAGILDILGGNSDKHGQATNPDGSPITVTKPK